MAVPGYSPRLHQRLSRTGDSPESRTPLAALYNDAIQQKGLEAVHKTAMVFTDTPASVLAAITGSAQEPGITT